jgi:hypothetical protein
MGLSVHEIATSRPGHASGRTKLPPRRRGTPLDTQNCHLDAGARLRTHEIATSRRLRCGIANNRGAVGRGLPDGEGFSAVRWRFSPHLTTENATESGNRHPTRPPNSANQPLQTRSHPTHPASRFRPPAQPLTQQAAPSQTQPNPVAPKPIPAKPPAPTGPEPGRPTGRRRTAGPCGSCRTPRRRPGATGARGSPRTSDTAPRVPRTPVCAVCPSEGGPRERA